MKKLALALFLVCFFLFRPYMLQQNGMWYSGDDHDYFAHASSIIFGEFPSYDKEFFPNQGNLPLGSIGSSLLASPFVLFFSLFDRLAGSGIIHTRTLETIERSWAQFGFVFATVFYFCLANFLFFSGLRKIVQERFALMAVICCSLLQGIPLFVFRRAIFSNAYEYALQLLALTLLMKLGGRERSSKPALIWPLAIGLLSAAIFLTRYNNIFMALIWLGILNWENCRANLKRFLGHGLISLAVMAGLALVFVVWPSVGKQQSGYVSMIPFFLDLKSPLFYAQRLWYILVAPDWGLLYTAPFILIGFAALVALDVPYKKQLLLAGAGTLVNLYLVMAWMAHGAWYGYRLFICVAIPVTIIPVAYLFQKAEEKFNRRLGFLWSLVAVAPALSMLFFEGYAPQLNVEIMQNAYNRTDFSNELYQFLVWKTFLFDARESLMTSTLGGIRYVLYLFEHLKAAVSPSTHFDRFYPFFDGVTLIRVMIIYSLPFLMPLAAFVLRRVKKAECSHEKID